MPSTVKEAKPEETWALCKVKDSRAPCYTILSAFLPETLRPKRRKNKTLRISALSTN